jgi:SAM-dependent methyltransferase
MPVKKEISSHEWDDYYRRYQVDLANRYLIPTLTRWGIAVAGSRLLEIGCGDGGCGAAFHAAGCDVTMMDVDERLVGIAKQANTKENIVIPTYVGDVFDADGEFYSHGPFDIVLFRDVIEHLEAPHRALEVVKRYLDPRGVVFIVFPPYFSPYGAHQQILPRKTIAGIPYNKLPYLQLLPKPWFLNIARGETPANHEVMRLRDVCLTISGFEKSATRAGFRVRERTTYLSRPTFALRYGLPVIPASVIGAIPIVRELVVTAAYYLLEPLR